MSILWFSTKRSHDQIFFRNVIVVLVYFVFFICKQPDPFTFLKPFLSKGRCLTKTLFLGALDSRCWPKLSLFQGCDVDSLWGMSLILVCLCRAQARYAYSSDRWYGRRWSIWTGLSRGSGYFVGQISQDAAVSEQQQRRASGTKQCCLHAEGCRDRKGRQWLNRISLKFPQNASFDIYLLQNFGVKIYLLFVSLTEGISSFSCFYIIKYHSFRIIFTEFFSRNLELSVLVLQYVLVGAWFVCVKLI